MKYLILLLMIIIRIKEIKSIVLFDTIKNTLGLTLFVSSLIEIYTRIPLKIMYNSTPKLLNLKSKESNIVLIFPGYGGPDKNTNDLLKKIIRLKNNKNKKCYIKVYDWSKWCCNILRAANDGLTVGKILGEEIVLNNSNNLKEVHLIGISVGSFPAHMCSKIIKKKTSAYVRLTLLDPFCSKGIFDQKFGQNNFGKDVDFAEQYLNNDDPVPFTNEALKYCYCNDVTNIKDRLKFKPLPNDNMHSWPLAFFIKNCHKSLNLKLNHHDCYPRGFVNTLK